MSEQSKTVSLIEASLNTLLGFVISMAFWPLIASATGIQYSNTQHISVVGLFTLISIARGFIVRRFFNNQLHQAALNFLKRGKTHDY